MLSGVVYLSLAMCPAGNTLGCNLSCPRAPSHRPPCTNSLAPAATSLIPESQYEGGGLAVDTPVIFHIAIQLPGTLAPGPSSTATWQGHRTAGSDGCCPSAHPTHPAASRQPLLCQPQDYRQPAPSSCQAQGLRPRVRFSQCPSGQGRLPAWPLRKYTDLFISSSLFSRALHWAVHCGSPVRWCYFPQPTAKTLQDQVKSCESLNRYSGCLAMHKVQDLVPQYYLKKKRWVTHAYNPRTGLGGGLRIRGSRSSSATCQVLGQPGLHSTKEEEEEDGSD